MRHFKLFSSGFIGAQSLLLIGAFLLAGLLAQVNIIGVQKPDLVIFVRQSDLNKVEGQISKRFDIEITNLGAKATKQFDISVDWLEDKGIQTLYYVRGLDAQRTVKYSIIKTYTSEKAANIMFYVDYKGRVDESNEDNNWQEVPIKVAFLPDLIISNFQWIRKEPYDQLMASATIKNIGKGSIEIPSGNPFLRGCLVSHKDSRWQDYCSVFTQERAIILKGGEEYEIKEFKFAGVPFPGVTYVGDLEILLPNYLNEVSKSNNKRRIVVTIPKWNKDFGLPDLEIVGFKFLNTKKVELTFKNTGKYRTFYQPISFFGILVKPAVLQVPEYKKMVHITLTDSNCCILPGETRSIMMSDPVFVATNNPMEELTPTEFVEGEEWEFFIDSGYNQTESNESNNSKIVKVKLDTIKGRVDLKIDNIHLLKSRIGERFEATVLVTNLGPDAIATQLVIIETKLLKNGRIVYQRFTSEPSLNDVILEPGKGIYYSIFSAEKMTYNFSGLYDLQFYVFPSSSSYLTESNDTNNWFNTNVLIDSWFDKPVTEKLPDLIIDDISFFESTSTPVILEGRSIPLYGARVTLKNIGEGRVCDQTDTVELRVSSVSGISNTLFNPYSVGFSCKIIDAVASKISITLPTVDKVEFYFIGIKGSNYLFSVDPYGYIKEIADTNNTKEASPF